MLTLKTLNLNLQKWLSLKKVKKTNLETFAGRLVNFLVAVLVLISLLSWLIPLISILVWLSSPGPIFFFQVRTGKNGRHFKCIKFRTMYHNEKYKFEQVKKNDPRVTPIGRWLRKTSLDEIPQFINVLIGNMRIIGPRPHPIELDAQFSDLIPNYLNRYKVYPGITGLAQARGARGITDEKIKMIHRLKYDTFYIKNRSLSLDIAILFWTVMGLLKNNNTTF